MNYPPTFLNELSNILGPGYDITFTNPVLSITYTPPPPGKPLIINLPPYPFPLSASGKLRIINAIATLLRPWTVNSHLSKDATARAREILAHLESPSVKLLASLYPDFSVEAGHTGHLRVRYMPHLYGPTAVVREAPDVTVMLNAVRSEFLSPHPADLLLKVGGIPWPILAAGAARAALDSLEHGQGTGGDKVQVARSRPGPPTTVAVGVPDGRGGGTVYRGEERSPFDGRSGAPPWTPGTSTMAARLGLGG